MKIKLDKIKPFKLKKWIQAEDIRVKLSKAVVTEDVPEICNLIYSYVDLVEVLDRDSPWIDIVNPFSTILSMNIVKNIPILLGSSPEEKSEIPWEYPGQSWYFWLHTFAKEYGYSTEYIAELDVGDAVSLMQEIQVEKQFEREWQWSLSEIAYPYNTTTQKSEFHALPRPNWMKISISKRDIAPQKIRIPKDLLPVGNVIRYENPASS